MVKATASPVKSSAVLKQNCTLASCGLAVSCSRMHHVQESSSPGPVAPLYLCERVRVQTTLIVQDSAKCMDSLAIVSMHGT
ncbi:hypothetical protein KC345_g8 [Hortaea werneckii]|nr:hypothetical protein KC345_g8 [Hortaea werneckii]